MMNKKTIGLVAVLLGAAPYGTYALADSCGDVIYIEVPSTETSVPILPNPDEADIQEPAPDPVNLALDFDIQGQTSRDEIYAGRDHLFSGQTVRLNVQLEAEQGNTEDWMDPDKEKIETDFYVRIDDGDWIKIGREYTKATNLDEGETHTEHVLYTVPEDATLVSFYVKTDAEKELTETNEADNVSRIETFEVSNLLPDFTVIGVYMTDEGGYPYYDGDSAFEDKHWNPRCEIQNLGDSDSPIGIEIEHRMDGRTRDYDHLDAGEPAFGDTVTETVWNGWKLGDTGSRVYQCCVNTGNDVPEINQDNNCRSMTLNVVPWKPDIVVSDLYLKTGTGQIVRNGASIPEDSVVSPYCEVENIGNRNAPNGFRLRYEVNSGNYRDDDGLDASDMRIGAKKMEYMSNGFRLGDTGNRTYRCCADYKGDLSELREDNNCRAIAFRVYPIAPRLVIHDMWLDYDGKVVRNGGKGKRKKRYHPNVVVVNVGNGSMKCGARVRYYINANKYRDDDGVDRLGAGGASHERVNNNKIKLGDKGRRTYRVVVSSNCGEFPTTQKTISFVVK